MSVHHRLTLRANVLGYSALFHYPVTVVAILMFIIFPPQPFENVSFGMVAISETFAEPLYPKRNWKSNWTGNVVGTETGLGRRHCMSSSVFLNWTRAPPPLVKSKRIHSIGLPACFLGDNTLVIASSYFDVTPKLPEISDNQTVRRRPLVTVVQKAWVSRRIQESPKSET